MQFRITGCSHHTLPGSGFLKSKSRFGITVSFWDSWKGRSAAVTSNSVLVSPSGGLQQLGSACTWWQPPALGLQVHLKAITDTMIPYRLSARLPIPSLVLAHHACVSCLSFCPVPPLLFLTSSDFLFRIIQIPPKWLPPVVSLMMAFTPLYY